jgi:hypothetical protein
MMEIIFSQKFENILSLLCQGKNEVNFIINNLNCWDKDLQNLHKGQK